MESVVRDLVDADRTLEAHLKALQELARDVQQESAKGSAAADQNERHAPAAANGKEGYEDAVAMDVDGDGGETPNEV